MRKTDVPKGQFASSQKECKTMHISTAHFDDLLQRLDPDEDREMYGLTQGLLTAISEMSYALLAIDSRLDEIEKRITDLEKK